MAEMNENELEQTAAEEASDESRMETESPAPVNAETESAETGSSETVSSAGEEKPAGEEAHREPSSDAKPARGNERQRPPKPQQNRQRERIVLAPADPVRGKLVLTATLHCETGLHIGAGKGNLDIGGADNPVVKDAHGNPLLPGSSLRGRLRSLLEHALGLTTAEELVYLSRRRGQEVRIHESDRADDLVCRLFGRASQAMDRVSGGSLEARTASPGRLTVQDAPLEAASITPQMREFLEDELTEVKSELAIDRITAQAAPRTLERVPAGARFPIRLVVDVRDRSDAGMVALLLQGLRLLEDNPLGGGGARGNGRVRLTSVKLHWRGNSYYLGASQEQVLAEGEDLASVQSVVNEPAFAQRLTD